MVGSVQSVVYKQQESYVCEVEVTGHPTEALQQAHELLSVIFRNQRWHITYMVGSVPEGYIHPSEFILHIKAEAFD